MRALVLSGGGARGAYEAGVIQGLHEADHTYDLICGTSIGALNGSFVAAQKFDDLAATWHSIASRDVIALLPLVQRLQALGNDIIALSRGTVFERFKDLTGAVAEFEQLGPLSNLFGLMGAIDPTHIEAVLSDHVDFSALNTALIVSGTNLTDGQSDAFYFFPSADAAAAFAAKHDKGTAHPLTAAIFRDAVRASAAIPFAFAPVQIQTGTAPAGYVDGGVANNTPIGQAIDAGADDVTVIFMDPTPTLQPQSISNLAQVGLGCFGIMQQRILNLDITNAQRVNRAIDAGNGGIGSAGVARRKVGLHFVRPKQPLPVTVLQFDRQDLIEQAYALGQADAKSLQDL
jgi:NTE family protein